ncbi:metallophosphoesterase family protein [Mesobaculum littorinae]|uniref:metallophosphoesterase family protein n=1 Tax=Mesobaculum littorinae TaxID=2486419 RepID=UPI001F195972|nr:metallophosphoesterase [Mesobaculum littorinae]
MTEFRFLHTSDLHLGRRFANIPQPPDGHIRGRLMAARQDAIGRIAAAARAQGAGHVVVAGDSFDTPTPSATVLRQSLAAMGEAEGIDWWLLPGNHDNLREAEPLWETVTRDGPANVHAVTETAPVDLGGAHLLPAPVGFRAEGRDLTAALPGMATPEGALRLGLAHGGVVDFTEAGGAVPPDRDRTAGLDYLALGDWHGRMQVSPRVQYPGSPEQDRFLHGRRGVCLSVTLPGPGAAPLIEEVETGVFLWAEADLPLRAGQDPAAALAALLPATGRREILQRVRASGWAGLPQQVALSRAADRAAPEFAHFELRRDGLGTLYDDADLDEIDRGGALRIAADRLKAEVDAGPPDSASAQIAGAALARLYAYVREAAE